MISLDNKDIIVSKEKLMFLKLQKKEKDIQMILKKEKNKKLNRVKLNNY